MRQPSEIEQDLSSFQWYCGILWVQLGSVWVQGLKTFRNRRLYNYHYHGLAFLGDETSFSFLMVCVKRLQYYCKTFFFQWIQYAEHYNIYTVDTSSKEKHIKYRQLHIFLYEGFSLWRVIYNMMAELISFHLWVVRELCLIIRLAVVLPNSNETFQMQLLLTWL